MADWMFLLLPLVAVPIVLLFRFVGCGELLPNAPSETPVDFEIALSSFTTSVNQGETRDLTVTITSKSAFNLPTTLTSSGAPGVSATFAPNPVTPPIDGVVTSTLTVAAATTAPPGSVMVTLTGTATGVQGTVVHSVVLNLTVVAAVADFALSLSPPAVTVVRGQTATFTVNVARTGGFSGAVALATSPAGPGIFSPNPATGASSVLTVAVPNNAPMGSFPFTVTGTSGALQRTANGTLTVT